MKKEIFFLIILLASFEFKISAQVGIAGGTPIPKSEIKKDTTPRPKVTIKGSEGGRADSSEISKWDSIIVYSVPEDGKDIFMYHIISYQCVIQTLNGAQVFSIAGANLSSDLIDASLRCKKGHLIIFFSIKVSDKNGVEKEISSGPVFRKQ